MGVEKPLNIFYYHLSPTMFSPNFNAEREGADCISLRSPTN